MPFPNLIVQAPQEEEQSGSDESLTHVCCALDCVSHLPTGSRESFYCPSASESASPSSWIAHTGELILGAAEVDTRAITKRLRINGSLIGVLSTDASIPDDELIEQAKGWKIVGELHI
jgi:hypothetical protein